MQRTKCDARSLQLRRFGRQNSLLANTVVPNQVRRATGTRAVRLRSQLKLRKTLRRSEPGDAGARSMGKPSLPIPNCKTKRKAGDKNGRFGKKVENISANARLTQRPGKLGCLGWYRSSRS